MILAYARCSTDEQAAEGSTTLQEQERKCRGFAMMRGVDKFDFVSFVDAGVSGSIPLSERPEGARMLAEARPGDIVVAAKLDRIFRSALDALSTVEDLQKRGIDLVLIDMGNDPVTQNGTAKLFFSMLAAFAEFERGRIQERMTDGRDAKRRNGGCVGNVPYGFRKVGAGKTAKVEPNPEEQEVIHAARKFLATNCPSAATRLLNDAGYRSRSGQPFQIIQVQRFGTAVPSGVPSLS